MKNKTVLVTGGSGFMGSHLCKALTLREVKIKVLDDFSSGKILNLNSNYNLEIIEGNIEDIDKVKKACKDVTAVIHAFPMVIREGNTQTGTVLNSISGLMNLLEQSLANKALFIYISSIAVYGNQKYVPIDEKHPVDPVLPYGSMKLAGECICRTLSQSCGLKTVILRVADIYGPKNTRVNVPIKFLLDILKGRPLQIYGTGRQKRTYTYIDDFVESVLKVLEEPLSEGKTFNISGGQAISIHNLALLVREVTGAQNPVIFHDCVPSDERELVIDNTLARKMLSLKEPVSLREGLTTTWNWLLKNPEFY